MKEIVINNDDLPIHAITETVVRVKALLLDKSEILLGYSHNIYQFPGGHVETGEILLDALSREISEETGLILSNENYKPFLVLKNYNRNYPQNGKNRLSIIYYYAIPINSNVKIGTTNFTQNELQGNFKIESIPFKKVKKVLDKNVQRYPKSEWISREMVTVLNEYDKHFSRKKVRGKRK